MITVLYIGVSELHNARALLSALAMDKEVVIAYMEERPQPVLKECIVMKMQDSMDKILALKHKLESEPAPPLIWQYKYIEQNETKGTRKLRKYLAKLRNGS